MTYQFDIPTYSAVVPDAVRTGEVERVPVAVVGGGIVGLSAAALLALQGVPVVLLDDDTTVGVRGMASRGICYANRTLQIFDRLGIYERMRDVGVTWRTGRLYRDDEELYSFDLARDPDAPHPPFVNVQQYMVEQFLVERLQQMPGADVRWANRVVGATQEADAALLEIETESGPYRLRADWVIAADGAHSAMRDALGLTVHPNLVGDTWLIVDVHLERDLPHERWVWIENAQNEGRAVWFHGMADNVWRLDYQLGDIDSCGIGTDEDSARALARRTLQKITGEDDPSFDLAWVGAWLYRTQVLDSFRAGRVFFMGDAAHVKSPFGARGGNSGVQDAENLAWKLAAVLRGEASAALLDSYSAERRAAAVENIRVTTQSARFLFPPTPFERDLRDTVMRLAPRAPFARTLVNAGRMSVANVYEAGAVLPQQGDWPDDTMAPGRAALDRRVTGPDGPRALLAGAGAGFVLYAFTGGDGTLPQGLRDGLRAARATHPGLAVALIAPRPGGDADFPVLADPDGAVAADWHGAPGTVYLLRPDTHVGWRARNPDPAALPDAVAALLHPEPEAQA